MKTNKYRVALLIIIFIAAFLRLWKLNNIPPGLTPDEASLGYNAYSILKTGRDEYGQFLPIIFKSFGDYKPGLYIYMAAPFVAALGLNEWSVRLPSALAGVLSVYLIYLISNKYLKISKAKSENLSLIAAFLLAINPWHIHFSRGGWEVNIALSLTLAGIYFFLVSLSKPKYLLLSSISFALTFVAYQGAKLATSVVFLVLLLVFGSEIYSLIRNNFRKVGLSLLIGFVISLPILMSFFSGQTGRLKVYSVFSYPRPPDYLQKFLDEGNESKKSLAYFLYHSETLNFTRGVLGRWFNHFSGRFLFFEGDWANPRHSPPNHGVLQLFDLMLLPMGLIYIFRKKIDKYSTLILLWLALSPLPSAFSRDAVSAVRAYNMLVPFTLISTFGMVYLFDLVKLTKNYFGRICLNILFFIVIVISISYYLDAYFVHIPTHNARYWEYGMKDAVKFVSDNKDKYDRVIFQQSYAQPYIYFLFYDKYDPHRYQKSASLKNYLGPDVGLVEKLDDIEFSYFSWPVQKEKSTLIVGTQVVITEFNNNDYDLLKEVKYPNGETIFKILGSKL